MDPQTVLDLYREARADQRWDDADVHAADLGAWMARGGFEPRGIGLLERQHARNAYLAERAAAHGWAA